MKKRYSRFFTAPFLFTLYIGWSIIHACPVNASRFRNKLTVQGDNLLTGENDHLASTS